MAQNSKSNKNKQNKQQQPAGKKVIYLFQFNSIVFVFKNILNKKFL